MGSTDTTFTFANSLDPEQARPNVGPALDSKCVSLWEIFKNFPLEK